MSADVSGSQGGIALGAQRVYINAPIVVATGTLANTARHIFLVLSGIHYAQSPGAYYEIYLNPTGCNKTEPVE